MAIKYDKILPKKYSYILNYAGKVQLEIIKYILDSRINQPYITERELENNLCFHHAPYRFMDIPGALRRLRKNNFFDSGLTYSNRFCYLNKTIDREILKLIIECRTKKLTNKLKFVFKNGYSLDSKEI